MAALRWFSAALVAAALSPAWAQPIVAWTEGPGPLGLGFPVPVPVDTPLPFDGFRTYAGLHARHQDFALTLDVVHAEVVGQSLAGRDIWAYRLGDGDAWTVSGLPEPAIMTQGGIHAREWQSPEVLTGIMETLVANRDDSHLYRYLLDNLNLVLVPVLNVDGFLQTQRYPTENYYPSEGGPRDGRMRRKNMLNADEVLTTSGDHLMGVDLNRNNPPFWAFSPGRSSPSPTSIVHHGSGPHSEPEVQAMVAASMLGPQSRLRMYTDVHSFSQVHFSVNTANARRNAIQRALLRDFSRFHVRLSGAKDYVDLAGGPGGGIGSTDEYFAETFQIPSWTLEIEPSGTLSPDPHPNLPGCGADYGGFATDCHDGFILPESEIRRVRDNLAQAFAIAYYHQAGPPAVAQVRFIDEATGAAVFDAEWDVVAEDARSLHLNQVQALQLDRDYRLWVRFDKPMRWRDPAGSVIALPGQPQSGLAVRTEARIGAQTVVHDPASGSWHAAPGGAPDGYFRYRDDAFSASFVFPASTLGGEVAGSTAATLTVGAADLVGLELDADPATPADWADGHWIGYEDEAGADGDDGGADSTLSFELTDQFQNAPFTIQPGISAAWFDPSHAGEGFLIEILEDGRAVLYWFTYDEQGNQRWFIGLGEVRGNTLAFDPLLLAEGGIFGPEFDPDQVVLTPLGRADFIFSGCNSATMRHTVAGRNLRQNLIRLTSLTGLDCLPTPKGLATGVSGSWYDPDHQGEGFVIEAIDADRVLVYWFTYDDQGNQVWVFGEGQLDSGTVVIEEALISSGGLFGDAFDPSQVALTPWGRIELEFGCETGTVSYDSALPGFGAGSQNLVRLTRLAGLECSE